MKGYKGYGKGLKCRNFQYEVGKTYEEPEAVVCSRGFHFCKNPMDVLDYYPILDDNGEFAEYTDVEALEEPVTDDDRKFCTKKIKIGAKLSFKNFVTASVEYLKECASKDSLSSGYSTQMASSGDSTQMASSGDSAKMASSGYSTQMASSGDYAKMASSGYSTQMASSGDSTQMASSGDYAKMASSGDYAKMASSGYSTQMASSGDSTQMASSGDSTQMASSGDYAKMASSGYYAKMASSGYSTQMASYGDYAVVANIGVGGIAKAKKGSWITLAEYDDNYIVKCVKTEQVDGKRIKEDVYYRLKDGEFAEV